MLDKLHIFKNLLKNNNTKSYNGLLITFGCSWTYGVGVGYSSKMTEKQYKLSYQDQAIANRYSFRGVLAKKFNLLNLNLASGGSSNQQQFRHARELFTNALITKILKGEFSNIIVLWSITSTARNEMWNNDQNNYFNFKYDINNDHPFVKRLFLESYNHEIEVKKLTEDMCLWNDVFKQRNISNIWLDTFNTHNYNEKIDNLIITDMMTRMMSVKVDIDTYHLSSWKNDDVRIKPLLDEGLINPISLHPTKEGHRKITDILSPYIEKLI
jgi:hypothetical protein